MFFTNRKIRKLAAQEVITEGFLACETTKDYSYLRGLLDMASELGTISRKQRDEYLNEIRRLERVV